MENDGFRYGKWFAEVVVVENDEHTDSSIVAV